MERVLSGIKKLDYLLKGFELGYISVWTGKEEKDNTTLLKAISKEALKQGYSTYYNGEILETNELLNKIEIINKIDKCKVFVIDNFSKMLPKELGKQDELMRKLKEFALNNKVHIHIIASPISSIKEISLYDIQGTANIINFANNVIAISRYKGKEYSLFKLNVLKEKGNGSGLAEVVYSNSSESILVQDESNK